MYECSVCVIKPALSVEGILGSRGGRCQAEEEGEEEGLGEEREEETEEKEIMYPTSILMKCFNFLRVFFGL